MFGTCIKRNDRIQTCIGGGQSKKQSDRGMRAGYVAFTMSSFAHMYPSADYYIEMCITRYIAMASTSPSASALAANACSIIPRKSA